MPTTIKLKNSVTTTNAPSSLAQGEVAINVTDKKVWVGNAATTPVQLLGTGADAFFSSITDAGNLIFTGTGNRITGDFSNATIANRVVFQSSTTNGATGITAAPNGTGVISSWNAQNSSDINNSATIAMRASDVDMSLRSGILGTGTYLPLTMYTGGSERLRIDTSGNLGIGTANPSTKLDVSGNLRFSASNPAIELNNGGPQVYSTVANTLQFATGGGIGTATERMRIDSSGNLLVGTTSDNSSRLNIVKGDTTGPVIRAGATSGSFTGTLFEGYGSRTSTNGSYLLIDVLNGNDTGRFRVLDSGNAQNTNNSYGSISDIKLKENIVDATPKLEKLNQVRVVNYNLIGGEQKQIGVIAQELEHIFPSMIEETVDRDAEGKDLGTTTKAVKYSVFVPMLIKAIQEQQAIITDLKSRIEALENK
jgi:hypothetical protein